VIDCAVVLHQGVFHLFSPDNGERLQPQNQPGQKSNIETGYHAISTDGLNFTRIEDVKVESNRNWLGCAVSDGKVITFWGTGTGIWRAISEDGKSWNLTNTPQLAGADPGAVVSPDGSWIVVATGPPRPGPPASV